MTFETAPSIKRKLFGTDGVRGQANEWPMTPDVIIKLAMATASQFTSGPHRHTVVIGMDTRLSGYMVESALMSGFTSMGFEVFLLGPVPTPAVALLTRSLRADLGVMISASHNPYSDNGIKFFGRDGYKLTDEMEHSIETAMEGGFTPAHYDKLGKAKRLDDASGRYIEFAKSTFPKHLRLDGLKIVVDCAHGAAYKVAPTVLWELGAEIIPIGVTPNGLNINDGCGATSLELARETVLEHGADAAVVLDGDADRLIMVDEKGQILDGDQLLALIATHMIETEQLTGTMVVATQMSNLGLERYLTSIGLQLLRTPVGDRYVLEAMKQHGANVGGEQSGHIILQDHTTTGDGLIAALQILSIMQTRGRPLSELGSVFKTVPQVTKNLRFKNAVNLNDHTIQSMIQKAKQRLGQAGYLLVRPSGTEPLLRLMAQGDDPLMIAQVIDELVSELTQLRAA